MSDGITKNWTFNRCAHNGIFAHLAVWCLGPSRRSESLIRTKLWIIWFGFFLFHSFYFYFLHWQGTTIIIFFVTVFEQQVARAWRPHDIWQQGELICANQIVVVFNLLSTSKFNENIFVFERFDDLFEHDWFKFSQNPNPAKIEFEPFLNHSGQPTADENKSCTKLPISFFFLLSKWLNFESVVLQSEAQIKRVFKINCANCHLEWIFSTANLHHTTWSTLRQATTTTKKEREN
jgi:hypothetical protein